MQNEFFNDEMLNRMYRFKKQIFKKPLIQYFFKSKNWKLEIKE